MNDSYAPTPMSRQEVYAWASILSSLVFSILYVGFFFGIPSILEPLQEGLVKAITILVIADLVFQTIISLQSSKKMRIDKDERDRFIEAMGFKSAYYVFAFAVMILIGQLFIMNMIESFGDASYIETMEGLVLHYLVGIFILGTTAKSVAQVILYRRDA